jgi:hypothetical protein
LRNTFEIGGGGLARARLGRGAFSKLQRREFFPQAALVGAESGGRCELQSRLKEQAAKRMGFSYRRPTATPVREGMPVDPNRWTGCIAKKVWG